MKNEFEQIEKQRVEDFNKKYPIGSSVMHRKSTFDEFEPRKVRDQAFVSSSGSAVAFFEGLSGYYDISDDFIQL